jgi:hypothetical protein
MGIVEIANTETPAAIHASLPLQLLLKHGTCNFHPGQRSDTFLMPL